MSRLGLKPRLRLGEPLALGAPLGGAKAAAYNPIAALGSSLLGYWDADSRYWGTKGGITQSGGVVSAWTDAVAGDAAAQGTGSAQPAFNATGFSGGPCLTFDGIDDCLTMASQPFTSGSTPIEIWGLISQDAPTTDATTRFHISMGDNNANYVRAGRTVTASINRMFSQISGVSLGNLVGTTQDYSGHHVMRLIAGSSAQSQSSDGVTDGASAVTPSTGPTRTRIGAFSNTSASNFHWGAIVAILVTQPLTAPQAAGLATFLAARK